MGNRAQRLVKRNPEEQRWVARLVFVLFGALIAATGYEALHEGYLWTVGYSARLGRAGFGTTLGLVGMGVFFIILGVIPWPRAPRTPPKDPTGGRISDFS
jgi:hypothetical protein